MHTKIIMLVIQVDVNRFSVPITPTDAIGIYLLNMVIYLSPLNYITDLKAQEDFYSVF